LTVQSAILPTLTATREREESAATDPLLLDMLARVGWSGQLLGRRERNPIRASMMGTLLSDMHTTRASHPLP
jgi:hypothetical protein